MEDFREVEKTFRQPMKVLICKKKSSNKREVEFIKNYFDHKNWIHHPAAFHIKNETYSPDFYDGETNTFIEVAGTRQAYSFNKHKYELFHKVFPLIKFEVRTPDGKLLELNNGRIIWDKNKVCIV